MKQLVKRLIHYGYKNKMSDLYILPKKKGYHLSFRFHLEIKDYEYIDKKTGEQLILYFKYLAGMDIAEKRKVQMGSTSVKVKQQTYRIRLSTVADFLNRETLVIRFLYPIKTTEDIAFINQKQFESLKTMISRQGLFIFAGPTGSGKSTSTHLLLQELIHLKHKQVITIEDPVEIEDDDCVQFQVNEKIGLTYQELIKVCLRHRPDVLLIGEIRDSETAKMAVRAGLTGHLVFSTIHAMNQKGVLIRLKELGISDQDIKESVKGVVYQEMIPMKNHEYGVLYDILDNEENNEWEKNLQLAYKQEKITKEVLEIYKKR